MEKAAETVTLFCVRKYQIFVVFFFEKNEVEESIELANMINLEAISFLVRCMMAMKCGSNFYNS
jgi:hypothetical protein